ncbi:MarR family transcriptional regulator, partial [Rhizobium ruizarguesonis]
MVRDTCLCMHVQRAARALARLFDDALRPDGLTNGQFSLM